MALDMLVKSLPMGLKFIVNILRSQFAERIAPRFLEERVVDSIKPQLDQIKSSINDLKMKDHKVAQKQFQDVLMSFSLKIQLFSSSSDDDLRRHSDKIEAELVRAQERAIEANHSGKIKNLFLSRC